MRRKAPKVGDVVRCPTNPRFTGIVQECEGIHIYVRLFAPLREGNSRLSYVRRDAVEVVSRANPC